MGAGNGAEAPGVLPTKVFIEGKALLLAVMLVLALFVAFNITVDPGRGPTAPRLAALILLAAPGLWLNATHLTKPLLAIVFALSGCCVFYLVGMHSTYDLGIEGFLGNVWLPVGIGLLAFRWPALCVFPALAIRWAKLHTQETTGLGAPNGSDFVILPDLALLVTVFVTAYALYRVADSRQNMIQIRPESYFNSVVIVAAGAHLSNYFYSGWLKLFLPDSAPMTWVTENATYFLATHATDVGALTLQNMLPEPEAMLPFLTLLNLPLNALVLIIQLGALLCLFSLRRSAWLTFLYDVMHVGIFLLTGIFFWKWIILNLAFVYAFKQMKAKAPPDVSIRVLGCVIVLLAPLSFHVVRLAWFDTGAINDAHFEVVNQSGQPLRVPSNFFLDKSISFAQQRIIRPVNGFLPTGTWGTTSSGETMRESIMSCDAMAQDWTLTDEAKARLQRVIREHHRRMLQLADDNGHVRYNLFPHHIWSAPWLYDDFDEVDLRTIRSYFFVVESRCVTVDDNGRLLRKPVRRESYELRI